MSQLKGALKCEKVKVLVTQSCLTLCNPMDFSPPGSAVHGILQARILDRVAISYSRESPQPGIEPICLASPALLTDSLPSKPPGETPLLSTHLKIP